jgi:uncharacterized protein (TIGR03032 family)
MSEEITQDQMAPKAEASISFTRLFNACLRSENISLVLACAPPVGMAMLGLQKNGKPFFQSLGQPGFGALTVAPDGTLWAAEKNFVWRWENGERTGGFKANDLRLYLPRLRQFTSNLGVADLAVDGFGSLLMASRAYSVIGRATPEAGFELVWKPAFITKIARENRCGLSGLGLYDAGRHCVSLWGASDAPDGWRAEFNGAGCILALQDGAALCEGLCLPVRPRWSPDSLYVLNLGTAELGKVDPATRTMQTVCACPGYPTGLVVHGHWAVVSVSARPPAAVEGLDLPAAALFAERKVSPLSGVVLVDLRTGDVAHHAFFENKDVEVHAVAVLPGCRGAMAFGPDLDKLDNLLTVKKPGKRGPEATATKAG